MFFANVSIAEKYDYLEEKFRAAYKWLRETDIKSLPEGSYPILGDEVVANVQEYTTSPKEERSFEAHDKRDTLTVVQEKPENDLILYKEPEFSGEVYLKEGDLIVVAPEDAHKPRCAAGNPMAVKKVVVKVAV